MSYNIHFPTEKLLLNHSSSQFQSWPMQGCPFLCGIQLSFKSTLFIKYTVPYPMKASSRQNTELHTTIKKMCVYTLIFHIFTLTDRQPGCLSLRKIKTGKYILFYSISEHTKYNDCSFTSIFWGLINGCFLLRIIIIF